MNNIESARLSFASKVSYKPSGFFHKLRVFMQFLNGFFQFLKREFFAFHTVMKVKPLFKFIGENIIDDVRIYNYARSAEQIKQDYNQGLVSEKSRFKNVTYIPK